MTSHEEYGISEFDLSNFTSSMTAFITAHNDLIIARQQHGNIESHVRYLLDKVGGGAILDSHHVGILANAGETAFFADTWEKDYLKGNQQLAVVVELTDGELVVVSPLKDVNQGGVYTHLIISPATSEEVIKFPVHVVNVQGLLALLVTEGKHSKFTRFMGSDIKHSAYLKFGYPDYQAISKTLKSVYSSNAIDQVIEISEERLQHDAMVRESFISNFCTAVKGITS